MSPRPDLSWHPQARLLREDRLGLTAARLRGIRETTGDLLVFADDDNVLDPDYLEQTVRVGREHPFLGAWAGQCRPEFDELPPEWTRRYWGSLCIREFEQDLWSNLPRLSDTMPHGAGLSVRRSVAERYRQLHDGGNRSMLLDRVGKSLVSGGDNDLAACACDLGLGMGLIAALKLTHLIPRRRLELAYLCRLVEGIQYSSLILDAERGAELPTRGFVATIADKLRLLRLRGPHREILRAVYRGRSAAARFLADK
jgi:glycosyltransferase involved in cell wall biosynthesis